MIENLGMLLSDDTGERDFLARRWPKPSRIALTPDRQTLLYQFDHPVKYAKADRKLVFAFLSLSGFPAERFADEVAEFARKYGVLQLCAAHEAPASHSADEYPELKHNVSDVPSPSADDVAGDISSDITPLTAPRPLRPRRIEGFHGRDTEDDEQAQRIYSESAEAQAHATETVCPARRDQSGMLAESIEAWRFWSRQAREMWNLTRSDDDGAEEPIAESILLCLASKDPREARGNVNSFRELTTRQRSLRLAQTAAALEDEPTRGKLLNALLNRWLNIAGAQLRVVSGQNNHPALSILPVRESGWLFTSIATQITFLAAGARRLLTCSSCGMPYMPKYLPRSGKRTYCPKCGRKAALRDAQASWRERKGKGKKAGSA
jgi:hypothetical protein